jgi:hypothetical protein
MVLYYVRGEFGSHLLYLGESNTLENHVGDAAPRRLRSGMSCHWSVDVAGVGTCPMGRTPPWQVDSLLRSRLADLSLYQSHNTSFAPISGLFAVHLACIS